MAWFGAAYAYDQPTSGPGDNYTDRTQFFGNSDTQAAQQLNQANGGQVDPNQVGQQTQYQAQANALGLANSARGGRGNYMARSAMLQAPQAQQAGLQAQYAQQQANYQNAAQAQQFEQQRRAGVEGRALEDWRKGHNDALRQMRDTNNTFRAVNGIMSLGMSAGQGGAQGAQVDNQAAQSDSIGGGASPDDNGAYASDYTTSDARTKQLLKSGKLGPPSPSIIIMIGHGDHEHAGGDEDDDEPDDDNFNEQEAGDDATDAMRALHPANFQYKPEFRGAPGAGNGKYTGIMAQDLEKTPAGKSAVSTGPDGMKRVDGAKLATLNSAALSQVIKDMDRLKEARGGGK